MWVVIVLISDHCLSINFSEMTFTETQLILTIQTLAKWKGGKSQTGITSLNVLKALNKASLLRLIFKLDFYSSLHSFIDIFL